MAILKNAIQYPQDKLGDCFKKSRVTISLVGFDRFSS